MVYRRRKYRRTRRRRRYKKRNNFNKSPIATKMATKLRYHDRITLNPNIAGQAAYYRFSANGCYDPDLTGIGHQPRGFDELMALYQHYTVVGSKITLRAAADNGNVVDGVIGVSLTSDETFTSLQLNDWMERSDVKSKVIAGGAGAPATTLTQTCSPKKFFGARNLLDEANYRGTTSANPADQIGFGIFCGALDSSADAGSYMIDVVIDYLVVLTEPKEVGSS